MISIVPATLDHKDGIHTIEIESFADPWSITSIEYELTHKHSICFVAINEKGQVIGHVSMRHIINEGHINNIAVLNTYRRQGVGQLILNALIKEAVKLEMIGLTLEVRAGNHMAISLYEKCGFVIEGYRKNYYSSPSEDAAIMWKKLLPQGCNHEVQI